jgi:hypothetical protein
VSPLLWAALLALSSAPGFSLSWAAPCGSAPEVSRLPEGAASVTVTPTGARWHVEVVFLAPAEGHRSLDTDSCESGVRAAALLLQLGASVALPPALSAPPVVEAQAPEPVAPRDFAVRVGAQGSVSAGPLPSVTPRVGLEAGLTGGRWALFLGARTGFSTSWAGGPEGARYAVQPVLGGQLSGCALFTFGRVRLGPCAVAGAEWWQVQGQGVEVPRAGSAAWVAVGADARLLVALAAGLFATAHGGVRVTLDRPSIFFENWGTVWAAPVLGGELSLGLGWAF